MNEYPRRIKKSGIPEYQLLRWQREGHLTPTTNGMDGRQRRIDWSENDVAQAKKLKEQDELNSKAEVVIDALGGESLLDSLSRARGSRDRMTADELLVVGPCGHRIVKKNCLMTNAVVFPGTPALIFKAENL